MSELLLKLIEQHGLAAVFGIASIAVQIWMAKTIFANLVGINRSLARLLEREGRDTDPPPVPKRRKGRTGLLPRSPTPLPFWPVKTDKENPP
jgi:hypothetical protein